MTRSRTALDRLARIDSAAISDALDMLGLPSGVPGLVPVTVAERVLGFAITAVMEPFVPAAPGPHILTEVVDGAGTDDVIVIDNAGRLDISCWGGILGLGAARRGVRGVIVDGVCRDNDENAALGLPVYARGGSPVTARGRLRQRSAGEPATIAGRTVHHGDIVLHDATGLVVIPSAHTDRVLELAEQVVAREQDIAAEVRDGRSLADTMRDARLAGKADR